MSWQDPERFEVVAIRRIHDSRDAVGYVDLQDYQDLGNDTMLDIVVTHYQTHLDARLGAQGLRISGFHVVGIKDRESDEMVPATPVTSDEVMP